MSSREVTLNDNAAPRDESGERSLLVTENVASG